MGEELIKKSEADLLATAIDRIISSEAFQSVSFDRLPLISDLPDSNKMYHGKVSILFVDMRESTKLPEKFNTSQLVKIYRSYIRTVVQAIRYSGGVVRDFMGDGVLAVFIDDEEGKSEDKAVHAARYITTAIDKLLNPVLDQTIKHRISCGIGIHTGEISISKVGMKGKEQQENAESEYGVAWIGNSTNLACKYSGAVENGTIFISTSTYSELTDIDGKQNWERVDIVKGKNVLTGYLAKQYYLQLDTDVTPFPASESDTPLCLGDELKKEHQKYITDIANVAAALGRKEQALLDKEHKLNSKASELDYRSREIIADQTDLDEQTYDFHCDVLGSAHCKKEYILAMGQAFWEQHCREAITAGSKIGKDEHQVKQEISYVMVDIYQTLGIYDKAYDFVVEQASGHAWLHLFTVQNIVNEVRYCDRLKSAIITRLSRNDLPPQIREEFEAIRRWLVYEYRR